MILLTLSWPAFATEPANPQPPDFEQSLRVTSDSLPFALNATRRLTRQPDGSWQLEVVARNWLGEIRETTLFSWQDCTPVTTRWAYSRRGLGQKRQAVLRLDRKGNMAHSQKGDRSRQFPIGARTTDKLSQTLALQCLLEQGQDQQLVLDVADEREREQVIYQVGAEEWLDTEAGRIRAVRVERLRQADSPRQTLLWFAPEYQHALVRLVQIEDDQRHQMDIVQLP